MTAILCLDVGSATQDALLWLSGERLENCPKLVLPSPARLVAARIAELTRLGRPIHLCGVNMGGGFMPAVLDHVAAGLAVSAHPAAALALSDDPEKLSDRGIRLSDSPPAGHCLVHLGDYQPGFWRAMLSLAGTAQPDLVLAAAQDHGYHPGSSNRLGRFAMWQRLLADSHGRLEDLLYDPPPPELTRLATLRQSTGGGPVMDTGAAAALGVLFDPDIERGCRSQGALVVNMGNSHVLGLLIFEGRLHGVYEHHTGQLTGGDLARQLENFRAGKLTNTQVWDSGGHGCLVTDLPRAAKGFAHTYVIGPRRGEYPGSGADYPAPGGDMMLAGCFGLLKAWQARQPR